jgi:hypothetical protein
MRCRFATAHGRLLVHCYGGCDFNEIMLALIEYGLLDGDVEDSSAPPGNQTVPFRNDVDQRRRKIQQAETSTTAALGMSGSPSICAPARLGALHRY